MMKLVLLSFVLLCFGVSLRPPAPYCRQTSLPSIIPITVNTTIRYDIQSLFDGYNLQIKGPLTDHIHINPKYQVTKNNFDHSFNFSTAKIKHNNRFLGLIIHDDTSTLVIGTNNQSSGVIVDKLVEIQDLPNLHCYDVDEIFGRDRSYAIVDCATFRSGQLQTNHFIYVDLSTGVKVLGGQTQDSFVKFNKMSKRNIQVIEDPFNRLLYVLRIIPRDGVDTEHQNQTYIELFLIRNALDPQIIDVIDHTLIRQSEFSIADYQIAFNQLYVLAYNRGLYEFTITNDQRIQARSFFEIKNDVYKFRVDRIGFNDDLYVAMTNGNQVYTYSWDVLNAPKLLQKYGLPAKSIAEQIVCNTDFVIVTLKTNFNDKWDRKHWIFTKRSTSYTHAFNVFDAPEYGPAIMQLEGNDHTLYLFHEYTSYNIKMSLPYIQINPINDSKVGQKEEYTLTATSLDSSDSSNNVTCETKLTLLYQAINDNSIIKTGFLDKLHQVIDSPDQEAFDLSWQFYGRNLTYDIAFEVNSSLVPHSYVDKVHQAIFEGVDNIKPENIVWFEMFQEVNKKQIHSQNVYGLVQVIQDKTATQKVYTIHYLHCTVNVLDRDDKHHLSCSILSSTRSAMGKIIKSSQMMDPHQRRLALVFDSNPNIVMIYYLWEIGIGFYGRKVYSGDSWNILSGVSISKGMLFCVMQVGKRIEIFDIQKLRQTSDQPINAQPLFIVNSQIMRFFGVDYWAPVDIKVSPFHDEVIFVKTKVGVMAINVNEMAFPELLFTAPTNNAKYDFEVNEQNLILINQDHSQIWHLYTPLRRSRQPFLREYINFKFKIGGYDEITADKLFYLVGDKDVIAINPRFTNNNAVYLQLNIGQEIQNLDAVNIKGRQLLFIHTNKNIFVYVIRQTPTLYINWPAHQRDFNLTLTASNANNKSEPYSLLFTVLQSNETEIKPSDYFNQTQIKQLGHVRTKENQNKTFTFNVTLNDSLWFEGNVFHYTINCTHCGGNKEIKVKNHVEQVGQLVSGRAIYDMQSAFDGIYAQQYSSYLKTWANNDSIHYIQNIPTVHRGEVCSKIAIDDGREYVVSLCETGDQVNVYITSLISEKPFTMGPYATEAKEVNHVKIVDDILMIVDNSDDPFVRSGGIYLYSLNLSHDNEVQLSLIDLIDNDDLRIQGYNGMGNIGSADLHDSHDVQEYRLFITDTFSGNLFIFSFQLSPNQQEIVYLSKKLVNLAKLFPETLKVPSPLRVLTVNIHYYIAYATKDNLCQYYLLFTVSNWHHFELMLTVDKWDNIKTSKVLRMFERIPWALSNYVRIKRGWRASQFAVPYIDYENDRQLIAIYEADMIVNPVNKQEEVSLVEIPLIKLLGVHRVRNIFEVAFAFHQRGLDTLLFTDMDGQNITELTINKNVTLVVQNLEQPENVSITAHNPYSNYTFTIEVQYIDETEQEKIEIIWYVIVGIGAFMILSLIVVYAKQKNQASKSIKSFKKASVPISTGKESLITVEDNFKQDYINRTSVDPDSVRNTVDYGLTDSLLNGTSSTPLDQHSKSMQRNEE